MSLRAVMVLGAGFALSACGGGSGGAAPSAIQPAAATITITSSGASPRGVVVSPGSQVAFVNMDSRVHEMFSDPHPEHTDCPEFDQVGSLAPGQTRQTGNLNTVRTCDFHDHIYFLDPSLRGTVTIR